MTRTEELLDLCDRIHSNPKVEVDWWVLEDLTKLVRLQHGALLNTRNAVSKEHCSLITEDAIAAFERFEQGGK